MIKISLHMNVQYRLNLFRSSFHYAVIFGKFLSWHLFLNVLYLEQPLFKNVGNDNAGQV